MRNQNRTTRLSYSCSNSTISIEELHAKKHHCPPCIIVILVWHEFTAWAQLSWPECVCVWAGCASNGTESRALPAVRAPAKPEQSGSSQTSTEGWLEEARKEAGFAKPFTVSVCSSGQVLSVIHPCGSGFRLILISMWTVSRSCRRLSRSSSSRGQRTSGSSETNCTRWRKISRRASRRPHRRKLPPPPPPPAR